MDHTPPNIPDKNLLHMAYDAGKNNVPFEEFYTEQFQRRNNKDKEMQQLKELRDKLFAKYGELPDSVPLIRQMRDEN